MAGKYPHMHPLQQIPLLGAAALGAEAGGDMATGAGLPKQLLAVREALLERPLFGDGRRRGAPPRERGRGGRSGSAPRRARLPRRAGHSRFRIIRITVICQPSADFRCQEIRDIRPASSLAWQPPQAASTSGLLTGMPSSSAAMPQRGESHRRGQRQAAGLASHGTRDGTPPRSVAATAPACPAERRAGRGASWGRRTVSGTTRI